MLNNIKMAGKGLLKLGNSLAKVLGSSCAKRPAKSVFTAQHQFK